jgi:hypothetical protein
MRQKNPDDVELRSVLPCSLDRGEPTPAAVRRWTSDASQHSRVRIGSTTITILAIKSCHFSVRNSHTLLHYFHRHHRWLFHHHPPRLYYVRTMGYEQFLFVTAPIRQ